MTKFFPSGLNLEDTQTPIQILEDALHDWEATTGGLLTLVLQAAKSESGNEMILVHGKHVPSNRTISLFSVVSRPGHPYPVRIQPRSEELPKFFKKSYYQEGLASSLTIKMDLQGRTVTNEWIAETPSEFRNKLVEVFNSGGVKSELLNLITGSPEAGNKTTAPSERPAEPTETPAEPSKTPAEPSKTPDLNEQEGEKDPSTHE